MFFKLGELKVTKVNKDGSFSVHPLHDSEYYKTLQATSPINALEIFHSYKERLAKYHYKKSVWDLYRSGENTLEQFLNLKNSIDHGLDISKGDIFINEENGVIVDGQHRCAILLNEHGAETLLFEVKGSRVMKIWNLYSKEQV
jgi:hypothetical protein